MGAKPLAVLDVIVCGKIDKEDILKLIGAINQACENQDCSLVGGEISEQPGVVPEGTFVLSSSVLGVVSKSKIIDGSHIRGGDKVIALSSNGLHTNGFSLVRRLITARPEVLNKKCEGIDFIDAVLKPHFAYYPYLRDLLDSEWIHGLAHITGDGIAGNLERILPDGLSAQVELNRIELLPVFSAIKQVGAVPAEDMIANFNLGVGMIVVVTPEEATTLIQYLCNKHLHAYEIGQIIEDEDSAVQFSGTIKWIRT